MNEYDVRRLALVLSAQTEVEAMKAHNKICELKGDADRMYTQADFLQKEDRLSDLAYMHNDQLI